MYTSLRGQRLWVESIKIRSMPVVLGADARPRESMNLPSVLEDSYGKKCTMSILRTIDGLTFRENGAVERVSPYILRCFVLADAAIEFPGKDYDYVMQQYFNERALALVANHVIRWSAHKPIKRESGCRSCYHVSGGPVLEYDKRTTRKMCHFCYQKEDMANKSAWPILGTLTTRIKNGLGARIVSYLEKPGIKQILFLSLYKVSMTVIRDNINLSIDPPVAFIPYLGRFVGIHVHRVFPNATIIEQLVNRITTDERGPVVRALV